MCAAGRRNRCFAGPLAGAPARARRFPVSCVDLRQPLAPADEQGLLQVLGQRLCRCSSRSRGSRSPESMKRLRCFVKMRLSPGGGSRDVSIPSAGYHRRRTGIHESARSTPQRSPWHSVSEDPSPPGRADPRRNLRSRRMPGGARWPAPRTTGRRRVRLHRFGAQWGNRRVQRAKQRTASRRRKVRIRCRIQRIAAVRRIIDRERLRSIADQEEPAAAAWSPALRAARGRWCGIRTPRSRRPFMQTAARRRRAAASSDS